jgi:hypothetical protein
MEDIMALNKLRIALAATLLALAAATAVDSASAWDDMRCGGETIYGIGIW